MSGGLCADAAKEQETEISLYTTSCRGYKWRITLGRALVMAGGKVLVFGVSIK